MWSRRPSKRVSPLVAAGSVVRPLLGLLFVVTACNPHAESSTWSDVDERPDLDHAWFDSHDLPELSLYAYSEAGDEDRGPSFRGPYGVGNGLVFGLVGLGKPLSTLHGAVGPTYEKSGRFFGDVSLQLIVDGEPVSFDREWIARPRGTGLVVTRASSVRPGNRMA